MVAHYNVQCFKLVEELNMLKAANQKILFIVPELIEHKPGNMFGRVICYTVVFEDTNEYKFDNKTNEVSKQ